MVMWFLAKSPLRPYMGKDFNSHGLSNDGNWCYQNYERNQSITPIVIIDSSSKHMQKLTDEAQVISKDDFVDYVINNPEEDRWIHYMSHELIGLSMEELEEHYFKQDPELREVFEDLLKDNN